MRKLILLVLSIFLISVASAEIMLSQPESIYSLGDNFYIEAEVESTQDSSDFFELKLNCGNLSKTFYKEPVSLNSGEEKIIEGRIADTYRSKTNTIFLIFEKSYPNHCFVAVIFSSDIYKFPDEPEDYYYGKRVRISGEVKEYEGKPEIILDNMGQIEVLS